MVRLKSRTNCPVGGFIFVDAAISPDPLQSWSFNDLLIMIINRRLQNPRFNLSTDVVAVSNEIDQQNAMRMQSIRGAEGYYENSGDNPSPNFPRPQHARPSVAGRVRATAAGVGVLIDWLGSGAEPVDRSEASRRALICSDCPQNKPGTWRDFFTESASRSIQKQIAIKNDMALSTPSDNKLGVCQACLCPLALKVHAPLEHIQEHLSDEINTKSDARCWFKK